MRNWNLSNLRSMQLRYKPLLNAQISSFMYENPDLYHKKEQEAAVVDHILQMMQQMLVLRSQNHTDLSILQTQITYYMVSLSSSATLSALYQEVEKAVQMTDFHENTELFMQLAQKIKQQQTRQKSEQNTRHIKYQKRHQSLLNKQDFRLNQVKNSFLRQFNALDESAQAVFLQSNAISLQEYHQLRHGTQQDWVNFVQKIANNTALNTVFVQNITENSTNSDSIKTEETTQIATLEQAQATGSMLHFLEQSGGEVWQNIKQEYASLIQQQQQVTKEIARICTFSSTEITQASAEKMQEIWQSAQQAQSTLAEIYQFDEKQAVAHNMMFALSNLTENLEICALSNLILEENARVVQQDAWQNNTEIVEEQLQLVQNLAEKVLVSPQTGAAIAPNPAEAVKITRLQSDAMRHLVAQTLSRQVQITEQIQKAHKLENYHENTQIHAYISSEIANFARFVQQNVVEQIHSQVDSTMDFYSFFTQYLAENARPKQAILEQYQTQIVQYLLESNENLITEMVQREQFSSLERRFYALSEQDWADLESDMSPNVPFQFNHTIHAYPQGYTQPVENATQNNDTSFSQLKMQYWTQITQNQANFSAFLTNLQNNEQAKAILLHELDLNMVTAYHNTQIALNNSGNLQQISQIQSTRTNEDNMLISSLKTEISQFIADFNTAISYLTQQEWSDFSQDLQQNLHIQLTQLSAQSARDVDSVAQMIPALTQSNLTHLQQLLQSSQTENDVNSSEQRQSFMQFLCDNEFFAGEILNFSENSTKLKQILQNHFDSTDIAKFQLNLQQADRFVQNQQNSLIEARIEHGTALNSLQNEQLNEIENTEVNISISAVKSEISRFVADFNTAISYLTQQEWLEFSQDLQHNLQTQLTQTNIQTATNTDSIMDLTAPSRVTNMMHLQQLLQPHKAENSFDNSEKRRNLMYFLTENEFFTDEILNFGENSAKIKLLLNNHFDNDEIVQFQTNLRQVKNFVQNQQSTSDDVQISQNAYLDLQHDSQSNQVRNDLTYSSISVSKGQISQFVTHLNAVISDLTQQEWSDFSRDLQQNLQVKLTQLGAREITQPVDATESIAVSTLNNLTHLHRLLQSAQTENITDYNEQRQNFMQFLHENEFFTGNIIDFSENSTKIAHILKKYFDANDMTQFKSNLQLVQTFEQKNQNIANNTENSTISDVKQEISQFVAALNTAISYFTQQEWSDFSQDLQHSVQVQMAMLQQQSVVEQAKTEEATAAPILTNLTHLQRLLQSSQMENIDNNSEHRRNFMQFLSENEFFVGEILNFSENSVKFKQIIQSHFEIDDIEQFQSNIQQLQNVTQNQHNNLGDVTMQHAVSFSSEQYTQVKEYSKNAENISISRVKSEISQFISDFNTEISRFTQQEWIDFTQDLQQNLQLKMTQLDAQNIEQSVEIAQATSTPMLFNLTHLQQLLQSSQIENNADNSVQRQDFMQFLSENQFLAGEIFKYRGVSVKLDQFLQKYFENRDIAKFQSNLQQLQLFGQYQQSAFDEVNNVAISHVKNEISQFIGDFNTAISYFTQQEWSDFSHELQQNLQVKLSQFDAQTTVQSAEVAQVMSAPMLSNLTQLQRLLQSSQTANTIENSEQRQNFMQFLSENALLVREILDYSENSSPIKQILQNYFDSNDVAQFHSNLTQIENFVQNQQNSQSFTSVDNLHADTSFFLTNSMETTSIFEQISAEKLFELMQTAQQTNIVSEADRMKIIAPTLQVLQTDFHELLQNMSNSLRFEPEISENSLDTTEYLASNIEYHPVLQHDAPTLFVRMQQKIERSQQIPRVDIAHAIVQPVQNETPYVFADTVVTRKPQSDVTPLVNAVSQVVYDKIAISSPQSTPNIADTATVASRSSESTEAIEQALDKHEKELAKLQNEFKNILKVTDISKINRRLEKKLQTTSKIQTIRRGQ